MLRLNQNVGLGALLAYFFDLERPPPPCAPATGFRRSSGAARTGRASGQDRLERGARHEGEGRPSQGGGEASTGRRHPRAQGRDGDLRDADVPKGQINVNAENGKIVLRGEVEQPEMISDLEKRAKKVQGVAEVENLLHTPGSTAPAKKPTA